MMKDLGQTNLIWEVLLYQEWKQKKIRIFFENVHVKSNAFALKTSVSSVKGTTSTNKDKKIKCFLYKGWLAIVRSPDPLADGSDFFKVRRGPCLG